MITKIAKKMVASSFSKLNYDYCAIDWKEVITSHVGIYLHVPFCERLCAFCPFHRVLFEPTLKDAYVKALLREIELRELEGKVEWVYFGGGTPNLLREEEISQILSKLKDYVHLEDIALEGKPPYFTENYLEALHQLDVTKISMGVESLTKKVLENVQRDRTDVPLIRAIIEKAHDLGIVVNADLMVGLPHQHRGDFLFDVTRLANLGLDQITTYPFTKAPGARAKPNVTPHDIFEMIETADDILTGMGYERENVWVFSTPELAKKSLTEHPAEYFGFGPSAFSKINNVQVVNPFLDEYLEHLSKRETFGYRIEFSETFDAWREFAHHLYDLKLEESFLKSLPRRLRLVANLLKLTGYIKDEEVTKKGRFFVHDLTIHVIENLPHPLSNPVARGIACMNIFF
ncbi:MAG: radical SAM protein [Candidatus Thorarchaeota archaeon]